MGQRLFGFNGKGRIVYHQAHYGSRCNRLRLRWEKVSEDYYTLQLKTGCPYDKVLKPTAGKAPEEKTKTDVGVYVQYFMTELWFDKIMEKCEKPKKGDVE